MAIRHNRVAIFVYNPLIINDLSYFFRKYYFIFLPKTI
jgi:hypothetical protein